MLVVAAIKIASSQLAFFIAFNFNDDDPAHKAGYDGGSYVDHRKSKNSLTSLFPVDRSINT